MRSGKSGRSQVRKQAEGQPQQAEGQPQKVGRPRIVASPEEMDRLVDEYVALRTASNEPVTLSGMILHLGLNTRDGLDGYGKRPEFADSVKRAKSIIADVYERRLHGNNPTGAIFALKNMGWSDRQEVEFRGSLASIDFSRLSDEAVSRMAAGEHPMAVLSSLGAAAMKALPAGPTPAEDPPPGTPGGGSK